MYTPLTSQRKLTLTARNAILRYNIIGVPKKLNKWPRLLFRPWTNHTCHQKPNLSCETVLLKEKIIQILNEVHYFTCWGVLPQMLMQKLARADASSIRILFWGRNWYIEKKMIISLFNCIINQICTWILCFLLVIFRNSQILFESTE